MPKISVIVPIYCVEKYLKECIDSILNQTFKDIEIILINDGSKDNCPQIIDEYAKKDNRITVIHKKNGGYGQSCNIGLEKACGEYISIIEPDDYIDLNMYENLYNIAKDNDSDIVKSCFYDNLQSSTLTRIKKVKWEHNLIPKNSFTAKECPLFLSYHPSIWSCIYKKDFLNKHNIRFLEVPGAGWSDNLFQVQTMCLADKINYTDNAYYYWRRLNENESEDLKDWTIPFKRSDEIHQWLNDNNIDDVNILGCLFQREYAYILLVLDKTYRTCELKNVFSEINIMSARMKKEIIYECKFISKKKRKKISSAKNNFNLLFIYIMKKLSNFRKKLIRVRFNKNEKSIKILGKNYTLYRQKISQNLNRMNLCFSANEKYVQHLCCALKSIFCNKSDNDYFNIIIFDGGIEQKSKKYISDLVDCGSKICFINVDEKKFKNCPLTPEALHINSLSTYYRFLISDVCLEEKILYLDCDIIVNSSLRELYNIDIQKYYAAGVEDSYVEDNCKRLNLNKYCNAGVILLNLDLWRKDNIRSQLFDWCNKNKDKILWQDQDVLNVVLQKKLTYMHHKFNTQVSELNFGKTKDFNNKIHDAIIIHFVGCKKPWNSFSFNLYKYYFNYLFKLKGRYAWKINYIKNVIKYFRKKIIKIRLSRKEISFMLLGKLLFEQKKEII